MNLKQLREEFGTDDQCLSFIFQKRYPEKRGYYRVSTRKSYVNSKGHQIYPLKGTIFQKTSVPLTLWFHALFLFAVSKNGVSAAELSRQLGVNYKTAHRMGMRIREVMKDEGLLFGVVECDETYVGGVCKQKEKFSRKKAVLGMVERGGRVRFKVVPHRGTEILIPALKENIARGSTLMTDEFRVYDKTPKLGFVRRSVKHGKGTYVRGTVHTNAIEGAWGHVKPAIKSTYRQVSYLQEYLQEFSYRYNRRGTDPFPELLTRALRLS